jgi:cytochrome b561
MTNQQRYSTIAIAIHWAIALLMIFMVFFGEELMEVEDEGEIAGTFLPSLHISIGVAILVLSLARLAWRLAHSPPPLPATMKRWEAGLSHATHITFYLLMIGIPVLGWLATPEFLRDEPTMAAMSAFGFGLPVAPDLGIDAAEFHEIGSNIAMVLIILHVLAALKHQFVDGDGLLRRMIPH